MTNKSNDLNNSLRYILLLEELAEIARLRKMYHDQTTSFTEHDLKNAYDILMDILDNITREKILLSEMPINTYYERMNDARYNINRSILETSNIYI